MYKQLPVPDFFDSSKVGKVWRVPYQQRAEDARAWAAMQSISAAAKDRIKITLLLVDVQNTFCIPDYELFVGGAVEDNVRLCEFIYRNLGVITQIAPTMDTHTAMQIFHAIFFVNDAGEHPTPGATVITADDIRAGAWKVNPAVAGIAGGNYKALAMHALTYTEKLKGGGKYALMIWPYHAMLGGIGHALVSAVEEVCFFHNISRRSQTGFQVKGGNPLTENYSVLRPEVMEGPDGNPIAQKNVGFIKILLESDVVLIAGQAKSHCVAWTIADLLDEIQIQDPDLVRKVYLLEDCTSPVIIPGIIDFTDQANEAFQRFADAGMHIVRSTEPMDTWPDITLD